ncbi:unnamed protein product, partial [Staurois parvus]
VPRTASYHCPPSVPPISACPAVSPISAHQCQPAVPPVSAVSQRRPAVSPSVPISATYLCSSVPPISDHLCCISVQHHQCLLINAHQCRLISSTSSMQPISAHQ